MAFKILCAGFSKDEKAELEAQVKPVLSARPPAESWMVSVVKTGSRLAITVDGPDERLRGRNFVVDRPELRSSLADLLARSGFGPPGAAPPPPARPVANAAGRPVPSAQQGPAEEAFDWEPPAGAGERRDSHRCPSCERQFSVTYESGPNEPRQLVSVACPHCWKVDRIEVAEGAALAKEYKAHKLNA